jgi:hypothetical protein
MLHASKDMRPIHMSFNREFINGRDLADIEFQVTLKAGHNIRFGPVAR